ncbi:MAG: peptidoglycan endopeptidase [Roseibacillus sp.]
MIRFAIVGFFLWSWATLVQAEVATPLVTLGKDGRAVASAEAPKIVKKAVAAGNKLIGKPYKYGGGHAQFEDTGYDCSGAASFFLREIGAMKGVRSSGGFFEFGEKGKGRYLTVWVRKGHVFVTVAGVRFDTQGQTEADGPRWTRKVRDKEKFQARRLPAWK